MNVLHQRIRLAVSALVDPVVTTIPREDGSVARGVNVCLLDQLDEAIATGFERGSGGGGAALPICVAAVDLQRRAEASPLRAPGMTLKASIQAIPAALPGNADEEAMNDGLRLLIELAESIRDLFSPRFTLDIEAPCPECDHSFVIHVDDLGEQIRRPAIRVNATTGAECQNCHQLWPVSQLEFLAQALGIRPAA